MVTSDVRNSERCDINILRYDLIKLDGALELHCKQKLTIFIHVVLRPLLEKQLQTFQCCKVPVNFRFMVTLMPLFEKWTIEEGMQNQHFYQAPQMKCVFANLILSTATHREANRPYVSIEAHKTVSSDMNNRHAFPKRDFMYSLYLKAKWIVRLKWQFSICFKSREPSF